MIKDLHLNDDNLKQCIHQNFSQTTDYNIGTNILLQQQKLPRKYKSIKCPEVNRSNLTSAQVPEEKQQQMKFDKPCQHHKAPSSMQISSSFLSVSSNIYCAICVYVPADTPTFNPVEDLLTQAKYLLKRHKEWKRHEEEERERRKAEFTA